MILTIGALSLALTGCELPFGIGSAWVEGEWSYRATNLTGAGLACDIDGLGLVLDQEGSSFSGEATGGTIVCRGGADGLIHTISDAPITRGTVDGDRVVFDVGTSDLKHEGRVDGRSMAGTVTWWLDRGEPFGRVILTGRFAAARAPNIGAAK